jgi:hypothetical protein
MAKKKITIMVDEEANNGLGELKVCSNEVEGNELLAYLIMAISQVASKLDVSTAKVFYLFMYDGIEQLLLKAKAKEKLSGD